MVLLGLLGVFQLTVLRHTKRERRIEYTYLFEIILFVIILCKQIDLPIFTNPHSAMSWQYVSWNNHDQKPSHLENLMVKNSGSCFWRFIRSTCLFEYLYSSCFQFKGCMINTVLLPMYSFVKIWVIWHCCNQNSWKALLC